jgi:hypothetical protein
MGSDVIDDLGGRATIDTARMLLAEGGGGAAPPGRIVEMLPAGGATAAGHWSVQPGVIGRGRMQLLMLGDGVAQGLDDTGAGEGLGFWPSGEPGASDAWVFDSPCLLVVLDHGHADEFIDEVGIGFDHRTTGPLGWGASLPSRPCLTAKVQWAVGGGAARRRLSCSAKHCRCG